MHWHNLAMLRTIHYFQATLQVFPESNLVFVFVCFVALRPSQQLWSWGGRSVHLTTLFPGQAWTSWLPVICAFTFTCNWQQPFLNESAEGRRMTNISNEILCTITFIPFKLMRLLKGPMRIFLFLGYRNVLKFRTQVSCPKSQDKHFRRPWSDCDQGLPCLLFWQAFYEFQPWLSAFSWKLEENFRIFTVYDC